MLSLKSLMVVLMAVMLTTTTTCLAFEEAAARLLVYKNTLTNPVVENQDLTINYLLINTGELAAKSIKITDFYDPNSFDNKENIKQDGTVSFFVEEIGPGNQISLNVTIVPKSSGAFESNRARIKYSSIEAEDDEEEDDTRSGFSTSLGRIIILSVEEHKRLISSHIPEWILFLIVAGATIAVPGNIWLNKSRGGQKEL